MTATDDSAWWMYIYKVAPCPIQERHDWSTCPHAHRGERAARRCPRTYSYTPDPCPEFSKTGACAKGVDCPLAHSVFESWLHPSRFRTQLCCFGNSCKRRICFFAHDASQLRAATHTPNSAAEAVAAAAAGTPVMRRTQSVVPAGLMSPIYGAASGSSTGAAAAAAAAAACGATWSVQGSPSVMAVPGGMLQGSPQQLTSAAMVNTPWMHTGMGWVPAGPGMGQPMLAAMPGLQPGMQQAYVQTSLMMPGMQGGPALIPVGPGMLDGLAAGFSGMSLQDQAHFNSSSQGYACMPAMLHGSGASAGPYDLSVQQGAGGLPVGQPGVIMYAQTQGPGGGPWDTAVGGMRSSSMCTLHL